MDIFHCLPRELLDRLESYTEILDIIELRKMQAEEYEERRRLAAADLPETE